MRAVFVLGGAAALILLGALAGILAAPRLNPTLPHAAMRQRAIRSIAAQTQPDVIVFGDSIVEFADLSRLCGRGALNAGVAGATAADVLKFAPSVLSISRPRSVILAVGVNDTKPAAQGFDKAYPALVQALRSSGAKLTVATIQTPHNRQFDAGKAASINRTIMAQNVTAVRLDQLSSETEDGVHLRPDAYTAWRQALSAGC